ncbi:MAG: efflux RND transporter permease subunit [Chitinophagaceae bacterium]
MIADTFIKRPVTAIVIAIVIIIVGSLSLFSLPISQYPNITPPTVSISSTFTGADAETLEETVITPIENQVNGSEGMEYIQSTATSSGAASTTVTYKLGTDVDIATLDAQNRAAIANPQLPAAVRQLGVVVRQKNPSALLLVALFSPKGTHNIKFVNNYANIFLQQALLRVAGVGDVLSRADNFSMRIWLKTDKMAELGLTSNDVVNALQSQNMEIGAGAVGGTPQYNTAAFEYTVLTDSRLTTVEEFENIILLNNPVDGSLIYLKDVARVELGKVTYANNNFVDGKQAAYLLVYQTPGSNALATANGVYAALENLQKNFPDDIEYSVPFETVSVITASMDEVVKTLVTALILVVLVVFLFLQDWRATLIPVLAIPVSLIGAFIFFVPLGFTINTLTLFGFVLAIGIVVDDAIVVTEAIQHYIDVEKLSPKEAASRAMKDISGPVVAIALILAAVFVPVGFIPGLVGQLYQQFAITIAISVLISAFIALSLTPALATLLLRPTTISKDSRGLNKFFYRFNKGFERFTEKYSVGVRKAIRKTPYALILLLCIYFAAGIMFKTKPTGFIPTEDLGRLYVTYELPPAASTTRSVEILDTIMGQINSTPGVAHIAAIAGLNIITSATKPNTGTVFILLKPWGERKAKDAQLGALVTDLQAKLASIRDASVIVVAPPAIPGLGQTGGFTFELEQQESTDDLQRFNQVTNDFLTALNKRPEISGAFTYFSDNTPTYQLKVDREKCSKLGVAIGDVYNTIQTYLGSTYTNQFTLYGQDFEVVAQADTAFRTSIQNLGQYYVRNEESEMVPLSTLISYTVKQTPPLISHFNLFRSVEVNGNSSPGYSSGQAIDALTETAEAVLPEGYGYEFSGLSREEVNAGNSSTYIFILSSVLVFLFLAALYESWSLPFAVLLAVPVGAFGAILALTLMKSISNNIYAQIGLITLIGLAAKNAILIVEFAKDKLDNGVPLLDSTMQAVKLRLRPILMTSLAFILGILPLAFATGAGAAARTTIGWTVLGGMLAATLIAIFIVPVLFMFIMKLAYGKKKLAEMEKPQPPVPPAPATGEPPTPVASSVTPTAESTGIVPPTGSASPGSTLPVPPSASEGQEQLLPPSASSGSTLPVPPSASEGPEQLLPPSSTSGSTAPVPPSAPENPEQLLPPSTTPDPSNTDPKPPETPPGAEH